MGQVLREGIHGGSYESCDRLKRVSITLLCDSAGYVVAVDGGQWVWPHI